MTNKADEAKETLQRIVAMLKSRGWVETKISHFQWRETDGVLLLDTAVEVGYVYGECTVRYNRLDENGVDKGTYSVERGLGTDLVLSTRRAVASMEAGIM
jgi:hypothetical protein